MTRDDLLLLRELVQRELSDEKYAEAEANLRGAGRDEDVSAARIRRLTLLIRRLDAELTSGGTS